MLYTTKDISISLLEKRVIFTWKKVVGSFTTSGMLQEVGQLSVQKWRVLGELDRSLQKVRVIRSLPGIKKDNAFVGHISYVPSTASR